MSGSVIIPVFPILKAASQSNSGANTLSFGSYVGSGTATSHFTNFFGLQVNPAPLAVADLYCDFIFRLPATVPSGTLNLIIVGMANATSGVTKITVSDAPCATSADPSGITLVAETQVTHTWAAGGAGKINEQACPLVNSTSATAGQYVAGLIDFNFTSWTLAVVPTFQFYAAWL